MLPVDAHSSPACPWARAAVAATLTGRSLNASVGFVLSSLSSTASPGHSRSASISGVAPSPRLTGSAPVAIGSHER